MKHLTHWILALVAITTVASFSGAWTTTQEPQKKDAQELQKKERKLGPPSQGKKDRAAKHAAIMKAMPAFKVTLAEAIQLSEKEAGGKAFSADVMVTAGKASIQVSLFVDDKFTSTTVDPETKKVTILNKKPGETDEEGEAEEGG